MTALATLFVITTFAYLLYRYAQKPAESSFRLDRFRPPSPLIGSPSHYDEQRGYSDLVAIYGRNHIPDPGVGAEVPPERAPRRPKPNPSCGSVRASFS